MVIDDGNLTAARCGVFFNEPIDNRLRRHAFAEPRHRLLTVIRICSTCLRRHESHAGFCIRNGTPRAESTRLHSDSHLSGSRISRNDRPRRDGVFSARSFIQQGPLLAECRRRQQKNQRKQTIHSSSSGVRFLKREISRWMITLSTKGRSISTTTVRSRSRSTGWQSKRGIPCATRVEARNILSQ